MANNFKTTIELSAQSPSGNLLYTTLELPATRGEITDAAHRLRNLPVSEIVITASDALPELADTRLDAPTVDELNFFASRVNALPDDELAALGGVFLHRGNLGEFEDGLTMKDKIDDLQRLLDEQDECLFDIGQRLSDIEAERKGSHRSTAARPSGSAVSADDSSLMPRQGSTFRQ